MLFLSCTSLFFFTMHPPRGARAGALALTAVSADRHILLDVHILHTTISGYIPRCGSRCPPTPSALIYIALTGMNNTGTYAYAICYCIYRDEGGVARIAGGVARRRQRAERGGGR